MEPNEINAYDQFLHTGKITDYLNYVGAKQPPQQIPAAQNASVTGENGAYNDGCNRAAGTCG